MNHRYAMPLLLQTVFLFLADAASLSEHNALLLYTAVFNMICVALLWGAPKKVHSVSVNAMTPLAVSHLKNQAA